MKKDQHHALSQRYNLRMAGPSTTNADRSAAATIRGFVSQAYWTLDRWLDLGDGEHLVCEGYEDVDKILFDDAGRFTSVREQMKDLSANISVRTPDVHETIFNFLLGFHDAHAKGETARFVFTTSAALAQQRIGPSRSPQNPRADLPIDVLATWSKLDPTGSDSESLAKLEQSVRELVSYYGKPPPNADTHVPHRHSNETLQATLAYITEQGLWPTFFAAVAWKPEQLAGADLVQHLQNKLASDRRGTALPAPLLIQRLLAVVLHTASRKNAADRVLRPASLEEITTTTADELRAWATENRGELAAEWLTELQEDMADLKRNVAALTDATSPRAKLLRHSERVAASLEDDGHFSFQGTPISLERLVVDRMHSMALAGSMLVVGDAGVGKSGALGALVRRFRDEGRTVVCLSANDLLPNGLGAELPEILSGLSAATPGGFLVVDALDTARGQTGAAEVRHTIRLVRETCADWSVVASVRTYDLSSRSSLAAAFAGSPDADFQNPRFPHTRHVSVPELNDDELERLSSSNTDLAALLEGAAKGVHDLLRNLFNLSIAGALLDGGLGVAELRSVHSQIGLLGLYWERRIATPSAEKYARKELLRNVVGAMLDQAKLRIALRDLPLANLSKAVDDLMSAGVLIHPRHSTDSARDDSFLEFSHDILFDYAGAQVWLGPGPERLAKQLEDRPDLSFIARPSLTMYFQRIWASDSTRALFWEHAIVLAASECRDIAKVLPSRVASQVARRAEDFEPLLAKAAGDSPQQEQAAAVLHHIIGALGASEQVDIVGPSGGPWCSLCKVSSSSNHWNMMEATRRLLHIFAASTSSPTADQLAHAGHAARAYLAALQAKGTRSADALAQAVGFVTRTFASNISDSKDILRSATTPKSLAEFGFASIRSLANEMGHIIATSPEFASEIYTSAFAHRETSKEQTSIRGGVMGLTSHRRQDYESGLHILARQPYKLLCTTDILHATRCLARVLHHLDQERDYTGGHPRRNRSFQFMGGTAYLSESLTPHLFNARHRRQDDDVAMVATWEAAVRALASSSNASGGVVHAILRTVAEENQTGLMWTRVLKLGAECPPKIGVHLGELLGTAAILESLGTSTDAGETIRAVHSHLSPSEQVSVEEGIGHNQPEDTRQAACLPRECHLRDPERQGSTG